MAAALAWPRELAGHAHPPRPWAPPPCCRLTPTLSHTFLCATQAYLAAIATGINYVTDETALLSTDALSLAAKVNETFGQQHAALEAAQEAGISSSYQVCWPRSPSFTAHHVYLAQARFHAHNVAVMSCMPATCASPSLEQPPERISGP